MKVGANVLEQARIKKLAEDGQTVEEICFQLNIVESCVQSYVDYFERTKPKKKATRKKKAVKKVDDGQSGSDL